MITYDLFSYSNAGSRNYLEIDIPDAEVFLYPSILSHQEGDQLFDTLKKNGCVRSASFVKWLGVRQYGANEV